MSTAAINGERPPSAPILLTSDAFDERDRFDAWREELMLRVMRVDVDVPDKRSFHTRLRVLILPNVSIIERRSTPSVVRRTAELVRDGDDSVVFSLPWRKSIEARGSAAEARVAPGEAIIHSLNEITLLARAAGFSRRLVADCAQNRAQRRAGRRAAAHPGDPRRPVRSCHSAVVSRLACID
jgi:hypothetical protein